MSISSKLNVYRVTTFTEIYETLICLNEMDNEKKNINNNVTETKNNNTNNIYKKTLMVIDYDDTIVMLDNLIFDYINKYYTDAKNNLDTTSDKYQMELDNVITDCTNMAKRSIKKLKDKNVAKIISKINDLSIKTMILTARNLLLKQDTVDTLIQHKISLNAHHNINKKYDIDIISKTYESYGLKPSYTTECLVTDNILFTSAHSKGIALDIFFTDNNLYDTYDTIIVVDDNSRSLADIDVIFSKKKMNMIYFLMG